VTIDANVAVLSAGPRVRVGEGPHWDSASERLTTVDILSGAIAQTDLSGTSTFSLTIPTLVGAAVPRDDGGFVAAVTEGFAQVSTDGNWTLRNRVLSPGWRMNDAKCDAAGVLWAGSNRIDFKAGSGAIHRLDAEWRTDVVLEGLTLPNGMGWSPEGDIYYLIDSLARELYAFDVNGGALLSNRRVLATFAEDEASGLPDGMCVDAVGALWIAMWGGSRLVRLAPNGEHLGDLPLPVVQPSSCCFGGRAGTLLFVTSAREGLELDESDVGGSTFVLTVAGVSGPPSAGFAG
jgi:sugar lactone lactonase YvrE